MTILDSKFDIIGHDPHPNARAGLLVVLAVANPPAIGTNGTPTAGTIAAGTIVVMDSTGKAVVGDEATNITAPALLFTALDGDTDFDGAFVHKITCIQGGAEFALSLVDNVVTHAYTPGMLLACGKSTDSPSSVGKWTVADSGEQIYGIVGPQGLDSTKGTLSVIVPQGICPAVA